MKRLIKSIVLVIIVLALSFILTIYMNTTAKQVEEQGLIQSVSTNCGKVIKTWKISDIRIYKGQSELDFQKRLSSFGK
ncbi:hypothetical protein SAMN02745116_00179 [Pilibacter termitis]|uniref:Uncharacterized protein n=1 Tax=Pilibacter termitis TaxID=263852 RepID=A0A1T4KBX7_9ENTE|nr:hypothetical protein [Pilibacter termitis]SJZ39902.1 hypothetical protein SAMN02745116_00179 [Pilibacter termitis]